MRTTAGDRYRGAADGGCGGGSMVPWRAARRGAGVASALLIFLATTAHIGDNNTHFRGSAGPYAIQVVVKHPGVVPGLADITVRVEGSGVTRVTVRPVRSDVGREGAPSPDEAEPVPGAPGLYSAQLWFMTTGAYSVDVHVEGERGEGTAVVPVLSVANRRLEMPQGVAVGLIFLGMLLFVGAVTIVSAAVQEGVVPPGEDPGPRRRRLGRIAAVVAVLAMASAVMGGKVWWDAEDGAYRDRLFEPLDVSASSVVVGGERYLELALVDPDWLERRWSPLVPDHGKVMHGFLIREPQLDAFAHVHPVPAGADSFRLALAEALPAGSYRLYADVTHESGFSQTLTDDVEVPVLRDDVTRRDVGPARFPDADPDDSWWKGDPTPVPVRPGEAPVARFADGTTLTWEPEPVAAVREGESVDLRLVARDPDGAPLALAPYMGMMGHAAVRRYDGSVFVHLHPMGSVSAATRSIVEERVAGSTTAQGGSHGGMAMTTGADAPSFVSFPYAFPRPGRYRLWVQVKAGERVLTAAFDVEVQG